MRSAPSTFSMSCWTVARIPLYWISMIVPPSCLPHMSATSTWLHACYKNHASAPLLTCKTMRARQHSIMPASDTTRRRPRPVCLSVCEKENKRKRKENLVCVDEKQSTKSRRKKKEKASFCSLLVTMCISSFPSFFFFIFSFHIPFLPQNFSVSQTSFRPFRPAKTQIIRRL